MTKSKIIKGGQHIISSGISSNNIIDINEFKNKNFIGIMKNYFKTRAILSQTESVFLDFKRKEFPVYSRNQYHSIYLAYKKKDKVDLMKFLSIPLFSIFKTCIKEKNELPFILYNEVLDVKLVQARIYSLQEKNSSAAQTWHQITTKFICKDLESKNEVTQYNIFERRETDTSTPEWRLCHIE